MTRASSLVIALLVYGYVIPSFADTCLTSDERRKANSKYTKCLNNAEVALMRDLDQWKSQGCYNIPQPFGCKPPYPMYNRAQDVSLQALRACYYTE